MSFIGRRCFERTPRVASYSRPFASVVVAAILFGGNCTRVFAQADPVATDKKTASKSAKTLVTADGWQLAATYYKSSLGQSAPVVLLLHPLGGQRLVWEGKQGLAEQLHRENYAVVTIDLRKHGESKNPSSTTATDVSSLKVADYQRMIDQDLDAVKELLYTEHQSQNLNMNKLAIVAADSSVPIALNFAAYDWMKRPYPDGPTPEASTPRGQDVRALVLLSPEANLRGFTTSQALLELRNPEWAVSSLTCFGANDDRDRGDARKIHTKLASVPANKSRVYLESYPTKFRGTDMLGKKELKCEDDILYFLKKHLMELPGDWRDRKNRLTGK